MKLTELEPRWLNDDVFMFRSPTGRRNWITCKRALLPEQHKFFYEQCPDLIGQSIVGTVPEMLWQFKGNDFSTLTVTPSIDASASGNWHGFITNGEVA